MNAQAGLLEALEEEGLDQEFVSIEDFKKKDKRDNLIYRKKLCTYSLRISTTILYSISAFVFACLTLISYYCVLILNFIFFISSITSYTFAPIYSGLSEDWAQFILSLIQVLLNVPYVEFYIYFIFKSINYFIESFEAYGSLLRRIVLYGTFQNIGRNPKWKEDYQNQSTKKIFLKFLLSLLVFSLSIVSVYLTFFVDNLIILFGMISYAAFALQMLQLTLLILFYGILAIFIGKHTSEYIMINKANLQKIFSSFFNVIFEKIDKEIYEKYFLEDDNDSETSTSSSNSSDDEENNSEDYRVNVKLYASDSDSDMRDDHIKYNLKLNNSWKKLKFAMFEAIQALLSTSEYSAIVDYAVLITTDKYKIKSMRVIYVFFILLNLVVIAYDIYTLHEFANPYYTASIVLRFAFTFIVSLFNIVFNFRYKARDLILRIVVIVGTIFSILIFIGVVVGFLSVGIYKSSERIADLDFVKSNNTYKITDAAKQPLCTIRTGKISLIDAFGYALGPYDVDRDQNVFDNQLKYFFGENWQNDITYNVKYINKQVPFIIYKDTKRNATIYGFRGFNSGSELALQIEMLSAMYVIPLLQNIAPLYDTFVDNWLNMYAKFAHNFGVTFFSPKSAIVDFMNPLIKVADDMNVKDDETVIFCGINVGGLIAKILGIIYNKQAISFVSLPAFNDFITFTYDLDEDSASFVVNIYTNGGVFSSVEPEIGTNLAIPWILGPDDFNPNCQDIGICDTLTIKKESVYRTFCTIVELCGETSKFEGYCNTTVGVNMESIREYVETNY